MTRIHSTFCRVCSGLCGIVVTEEDGVITKILGDPEHPMSEGYTCTKGRKLGVVHHHPDRLDYPLVRRGSELVGATWAESICGMKSPSYSYILKTPSNAE